MNNINLTDLTDEQLNNIMKAVDQEGQYEVIISFTFKDDSSEYLAYVKDVEDENAEVEILISTVTREDDVISLDEISDEDYQKVIDVLDELAKED